MADTGWLAPTAFVDVDTEWSNETNAYSNDGSYATCVPTAIDPNVRLSLTTFGFSIPAGATINGIAVNVEMKEADADSVQMRVYLSGDAGSTWSDIVYLPSGDYLPTVDTLYENGGASSLWGYTWTVTKLSDANFICRINAQTVAGTTTVSLDYVAIKVYYTEATTTSTTTTSTTTTSTSSSTTRSTSTSTSTSKSTTTTSTSKSTTTTSTSTTTTIYPGCTNLVINPSFEVAGTWSKGGLQNCAFPNTEQKYDGYASCKMIQDAGAFSSYLYQDIAVNAGQTIKFSAYAYLSARTAGGMILKLKKADYSEEYASSDTLSTTGAWTRLTGTYTVADGVSSIRFILDCTADTDAWTGYYDAVMFEVSGSVSDYCPISTTTSTSTSSSTSSSTTTTSTSKSTSTSTTKSTSSSTTTVSTSTTTISTSSSTTTTISTSTSTTTTSTSTTTTSTSSSTSSSSSTSTSTTLINNWKFRVETV